jgi:NAD(P)-dependent dehydrogenase (short-subunit alcohol dehydrogenase family)
MRNQGKCLVVTGGGSGIGAAIARRFTLEGGRVAILDVALDRAAEVASGLAGALAIECDITDEASVESAIAQAAAELGRIDCVANVAGYHVYVDFEALSLEAWNRMLAVHVTGSFLVTRASLPHLRRAGGGSIVNYGSIAAVLGRPKSTAYCTAKAAITGLSRQLAVELAPDRIRVNTVSPGRVLTPMSTQMYTDMGDGDMQAGIERAVVDTPLGRVADPDELAHATCFLLSDESSFVTGTNLMVDGGMSIL